MREDQVVYAHAPNLSGEQDPTLSYSMVWSDSSGRLHREDGPARIDYNGASKSWYKNGIFHRDDNLPSFEGSTGKVWHVNGKYHRTNGPAIKWNDINEEWWINGKCLNIFDVYNFCLENGIDKDNMTEEDSLIFLLKFS